MKLLSAMNKVEEDGDDEKRKWSKEIYIELAAFSDSIYDRGRQIACNRGLSDRCQSMCSLPLVPNLKYDLIAHFMACKSNDIFMAVFLSNS